MQNRSGKRVSATGTHFHEEAAVELPLTSMHIVMKRIEDEDLRWKSREAKEARKRARKAAKEAAAAATLGAESAPTSSHQFASITENFAANDESASKKRRIPGFY